MLLLRFIRRTRLICLLPVLVSGCTIVPSNEVGGGDAVALAPPAARTQYEQAVSAMAAGDVVEAELRFSEFQLRYPGYPGTHVNLAILQSRAGNDSEAEASILHALQLNPDHAAALNQLGMLRRRQGRFADAETAYLAALAAEPGYRLAHYNLGVLNELYLQRLAPALEHYQKYQGLGASDKWVEKWIVDLERRIAASQRTANVTE